MSRNNYEVLPHKNGWILQLEGKPITWQTDKGDAVHTAVMFAQQNTPSSVTVVELDGSTAPKLVYEQA